MIANTTQVKHNVFIKSYLLAFTKLKPFIILSVFVLLTLWLWVRTIYLQLTDSRNVMHFGVLLFLLPLVPTLIIVYRLFILPSIVFSKVRQLTNWYTFENETVYQRVQTPFSNVLNQYGYEFLIKYYESANVFFLFTRKAVLVIDKAGFTNGTAEDFKILLKFKGIKRINKK